jgi:lipid-A-disaccharide synthase
MPLEPDQHAARTALGLPAGAPVLALLPGSRLGEIARLGRDFVDAAKLLVDRVRHLRIVAPMANAECRDAFEAIAREAGMPTRHARWYDAEPADARPAMLLLSGESGVGEPQGRPLSQLAMVAADAVLLASGTATLEAMLAKRPMVVAYRIAPLTHRIVKGLGLLKVGRYALPNVLAGRDIAPELMQDDCTPDALADALTPLLQARAADPELLAEYRRLHLALRRDASASAAAAIADYVATAAA